MPHIAMFSVGAHGHVNPSLPVIAELVARGHRVSYAVPESFARIAASAGATPVAYRSVLPDEEAGEHWPDGRRRGHVDLPRRGRAGTAAAACRVRPRPPRRRAVRHRRLRRPGARALLGGPARAALPGHSGVGGLCGGHGRGVRRDTG